MKSKYPNANKSYEKVLPSCLRNYLFMSDSKMLHSQYYKEIGTLTTPLEDEVNEAIYWKVQLRYLTSGSSLPHSIYSSLWHHTAPLM